MHCPTVRTPGGLRLSGNEILVKTFAEPGLQSFASRVFSPLTMRRVRTETEMKRMARWQLAAGCGFSFLYSRIFLPRHRAFVPIAFSQSLSFSFCVFASLFILLAPCFIP